MGKHHWSLEDDYVCCKAYLEYIFLNEIDYGAKELVERIYLKLPHISRESIRMKLQNIKALALDCGLEDSFEISPLANYSVQCKRAFQMATDDLGKIINH